MSISGPWDPTIPTAAAPVPQSLGDSLVKNAKKGGGVFCFWNLKDWLGHDYSHPYDVRFTGSVCVRI